MMSLIGVDADCQSVSTLKADILNITYAYKLLVRILCWYLMPL